MYINTFLVSLILSIGTSPRRLENMNEILNLSLLVVGYCQPNPNVKRTVLLDENREDFFAIGHLIESELDDFI